MQLPRGTFREIKRGIRVFDLIEEVERIGFSGLCTISYGTENVTLVFRSGKCILADFLGRHGDSAWEELRKADDQEIDAALSTLDEAQIQLSLEFNKSSRITRAAARPAGPAAPARGAAPAKAPPPLPRKPAVHPPQAPLHTSVKTPPRHGAPAVPSRMPSHEQVRAHAPGASPSHKPAISERLPAVHEAAPERKAVPAEQEDHPAAGEPGPESDLDTFDTVDLENVADKIRSDCKTMIKQLHLEHLMER